MDRDVIYHLNQWNRVKKEIVNKKMRLTIKSRDIFWAKLGYNVGNEQYGKGEEFTRPVIVIRQLTADLFIGVPTTTQSKVDNDYFHNIKYRDKEGEVLQSCAMLLQLKVCNHSPPSTPKTLK